MRVLKGDDVLHACAAGGIEFIEQFFPFDREEADGHIAVERLDVGPTVHAVFVGESLVDAEVVVELAVVDLSVLEGEDVDSTLNVAKNFVPFAFVLLDGGRFVSGHNLVGLDAVDIGRNHGGEIARNFFGVASHLGKNLRDVAGATAHFLREIPSGK